MFMEVRQLERRPNLIIFRLKKTLLVFLVLKRFILREPETAHRVYVLITGGQEFESRRKDSLGT